MEFLLHLWDELDDWTAACRHVTASAASELVSAAVPFSSFLIAIFALKILR
jgi:hypothetical protein